MTNCMMRLADSSGHLQARQSPPKDCERSLAGCKHGASRGAGYMVCLHSCPFSYFVRSTGSNTVQVLAPMWLLQQGGDYLPGALGLWSAAAVVASAGLLAKRGAE